MSDIYQQFLKAGEAQLSALRGKVCHTTDEHAAMNVAIHGNPAPPASAAIVKFLAQARTEASHYPGEMVVENHLLSSLVRFAEEDLIALRPFRALEPSAQVLIGRLETLLFTP